MPAGGDVIELVHEQTYLGQQVNNIYYFEAAVADASMSGLAAWFEINVLPDIKNIQTELVTHVALRLRNLFNLAETYEEPLTGTGAQTAGLLELPAFMAATFRLDHTTGSIRSGFKRYSGLNEGQLEDAVLTATFTGSLGAIAANLVNPPVDANPDWAHVIVKRVCDELNPVAGAVPSCLRYVLPRSQAEKDVAYPISYEVYAQPTTQNTRKWYT